LVVDNAMPESNHICRYCGETVSYNNMARPCRVDIRLIAETQRHHQSIVDLVRHHLIVIVLLHANSWVSVRPSVVTPEDIREATLCIIRRNDGYNILSMSRYLEVFLPENPSRLVYASDCCRLYSGTESIRDAWRHSTPRFHWVFKMLL